MAFKVFSGGATLSAADLNDYLMEQSIIVCTSGTRPASPAEGWTIYETDTDLYLMYSGSAWVTLAQPGAWTSYTPVLKGASAGTSATLDGTSASRYRRIGRSIRWHGYLKLDSIPGGWAADIMELELPVAADVTFGFHVGTAYAYDNSGNVICEAVVTLASSTKARFTYTAGTGPTGTGTNFVAGTLLNTPWTWAVDDQILWTVEYEAAS